MSLKNYLGLLNNDKTMIEYLVLYEDTIDRNGKNRQIYVPLLDKTFKSEDNMRAFHEAMHAIEEYVGWNGKSENSFISVAWQGEVTTVRTNIPFDEKGHIIIKNDVLDDLHNQLLEEFYDRFVEKQKDKEQKPVETDTKNFWDLV